MAAPIAERLAVCSWSLEPAGPDELIDKLERAGLSRVVLALDPLRQGEPWADAGQRLADAGIELVGGMFASVGEDYSTLDSIRRTGGIVPDETWPRTWANVEQMIPIAEGLGLDYVMFHAGFLPDDPTDENFEKLLDRVRQLADAFAAIGVTLGMETGQESAEALLRFYDKLGRDNVGVNFDPANMILYNTGDPIESLRTLMPHMKQVHIKDAVRTDTPGTWGSEVVVGEGEVDWPAFFNALDEGGYTGYLAIEREAGDDRVGDIDKARRHVLSVVGENEQ